jgi:hypothetical protein
MAEQHHLHQPKHKAEAAAVCGGASAAAAGATGGATAAEAAFVVKQGAANHRLAAGWPPW